MEQQIENSNIKRKKTRELISKNKIGIGKYTKSYTEHPLFKIQSNLNQTLCSTKNNKWK